MAGTSFLIPAPVTHSPPRAGARGGSERADYFPPSGERCCAKPRKKSANYYPGLEAVGVPEHGEEAGAVEIAHVAALQRGVFEARLRVQASDNIVIAGRQEVAAGTGAGSLTVFRFDRCTIKLEPAVNPGAELLAEREDSADTDQRRVVVVLEVPRRSVVDRPPEARVVERLVLVDLGLRVPGNHIRRDDPAREAAYQPAHGELGVRLLHLAGGGQGLSVEDARVVIQMLVALPAS